MKSTSSGSSRTWYTVSVTLAESLSIEVYCGVNTLPSSSRSSSMAGTVVVSASSPSICTGATMLDT